MSEVNRLENDHMRLMYDARKRRLIAVYVAVDEIFFLLKSPGKLSFPFCSEMHWNLPHFLGLTPVSRLHVGGFLVAVCLVTGVFPGPQADWAPLRLLHCPRFSRFLSWHIYLVLFVNGHYWC